MTTTERSKLTSMSAVLNQFACELTLNELRCIIQYAGTRVHGRADAHAVSGRGGGEGRQGERQAVSLRAGRLLQSSDPSDFRRERGGR
jgi:hypothetical protein